MMRTLLVLCTLLPSTLLAAEQLATVLQQTPLLAEPFSDSTQLSTLKARQQVSVIQRKGGWYQVHRGKQSGWLRMSRVRFGNGATTTTQDSGLGQALGLLTTGRSGSSGVTVATGIRGLDSADMANAKPDHQALSRLDRFQAKPEQSRQFADQVPLHSQPVGYFAEQ